MGKREGSFWDRWLRMLLTGSSEPSLLHRVPLYPWHMIATINTEQVLRIGSTVLAIVVISEQVSDHSSFLTLQPTICSASSRLQASSSAPFLWPVLYRISACCLMLLWLYGNIYRPLWGRICSMWSTVKGACFIRVSTSLALSTRVNVNLNN